MKRRCAEVTVEGDEKPYSAYGKYYMRSADKDREISPQQLRHLMLSIIISQTHPDYKPLF